MKPFTCQRCIRRQSQAAEGVLGGITKEEAIRIGWQLEPQVLCPFCLYYLRGPLPLLKEPE